MRILIIAIVALAAAPVALAQTDADGCGGGIGVLLSSCSFECTEGESLSAYVDGLALAEASCGGARACSFAEFCSGSSNSVEYTSYGSCTVRGYVWVSYGCSSS